MAKTEKVGRKKNNKKNHEVPKTNALLFFHQYPEGAGAGAPGEGLSLEDGEERYVILDFPMTQGGRGKGRRGGGESWWITLDLEWHGGRGGCR